MARVFLDANALIDLVERRENQTVGYFSKEKLFISPLSLHILLYVFKRKVPYRRLLDIEEIFTLITLDEFISYKALSGPTSDFEDNIQLHSAAEGGCDFFLTSDKKLLEMKFFGKTKLILPENLK